MTVRPERVKSLTHARVITRLIIMARRSINPGSRDDPWYLRARSPFAGPRDIPRREEWVNTRPPYLSPSGAEQKILELNAYRTLIGGDPGCDVLLTGSGVPARCAQIIQRGFDRYFLTVLGSPPRIFVNGRPVNRSVRIRHGDRIAFGSEELVFHDTCAQYRMPRRSVAVYYFIAIAGFIATVMYCYLGLKLLHP